jgi:hypothetical protein
MSSSRVEVSGATPEVSRVVLSVMYNRTSYAWSSASVSAFSSTSKAPKSRWQRSSAWDDGVSPVSRVKDPEAAIVVLDVLQKVPEATVLKTGAYELAQFMSAQLQSDQLNLSGRSRWGTRVAVSSVPLQ